MAFLVRKHSKTLVFFLQKLITFNPSENNARVNHYFHLIIEV